MKDYIESLKRAFGSRYLNFGFLEGDEMFSLYISGREFSSIDWNNIIQIGWQYHIGIVKIESIGDIKKGFKIHLRAY